MASLVFLNLMLIFFELKFKINSKIYMPIIMLVVRIDLP